MRRDRVAALARPGDRAGETILALVLLALAHLAASLAAAQAARLPTTLPRVLTWEESLRGSEEEALRWPVAVAAAGPGEVAVADAFEPRLLLFRKVGVSWQLQRTVPLPAVPIGLTWDGRRYLVSLRQGRGIRALEGDDLSEPRLALPAGSVPGHLAAVDGGGLLVHDYAAGRVHRLDAAGRSAGDFAVEGYVTALAAAPDGGFYVALGNESAVARYGADGGVAETWPLPADGPVPAWPVAIAAGPDGRVAVVDRHGGRILVLDSAGRLLGVGSREGSEPGLLLSPRGIARLPDGRLLVADEGNGRAQIFRRSDRGAP